MIGKNSKAIHQIKSQRGFIWASAGMAIIAAVMAFMMMWMDVLAKRAEAKKYESILVGQQHIFDGLDQYFELACNQNGVVPLPTFSDLSTGGYIDTAIFYNPYSYTYTINIVRPTITFSPDTNRAIADGRTTFSLIATIADSRQREQLMYLYRKSNVDYSLVNKTITVSRPYQKTNASEDEYSFLYEGLAVGSNSGTYVCI